MKMKWKVTLLSVIAIIFCYIFNWYFRTEYIQPTYHKIEVSEAKQDVVRCMNAVHQEILYLSSANYNLASSNQIRDFMLNNGRKLSGLDSINNSLDSKLFDFYFLWDNKKKIITKKVFLEDKPVNNKLSAYFISNKLVYSEDDKSPYSKAGLINSPYGIIFVASNGIYDSTSKVCLGTLITGKFLSETEVAKIAKKIGIQFNITAFDNSNSVNIIPGKILANIKKNLKSIYIDDADSGSDFLDCYVLFPDINKNYNILFTTQFQRIIYLEANVSLDFYLISANIFGIILVVILTILIRILVVKPITQLTKRTTEIIASKDLSHRTKFEVRRDEIGDLSKAFDSLLDQLQTLIESMQETIRQKTVEVRTVREDVILRLSAAIENKDGLVHGHNTRVAKMAYLLATKLSFPKSKCEILGVACLMHDIGKIGLPECLLSRTEKYSDEEYKEIKKHTVIGANIFAKGESELIETARIVALYHHEQWNGMGYPEGLKEKNIPIEARITCVVDVYDALLSDRIDRSKWTQEAAAKYLKDNRGLIFDTEIVDVFLNYIEEFDAIRKSHPDRVA